MIGSQLLLAGFVLLVSASCVAFAKFALAGFRLDAFVPVARRSLVPWNLFDIWLGFVFVLSGQLIAAVAIRTLFSIDATRPSESHTPEERAIGMIASSLSMAFAAAALASYLTVARRTSLQDFGFSWRQPRTSTATGGDANHAASPTFAAAVLSDVRHGAGMFALLFGPVILIQISLTAIWPSKHPIIELIVASQSSLPIWACVISAVIVAPLVEEFFFRAVLQGWFEKLAIHADLLATRISDDAAGATLATMSAKPWWPVVASAALFSFAHFGHGPDVVALFIFALGLGRLYQHTHRLLPCIIVHGLLNSWSMLALLASLNEAAK